VATFWASFWNRRKAAIPPDGGWQGEIPTETGSTQGTFFFAPRYCRHWKVDPTSILMMVRTAARRAGGTTRELYPMANVLRRCP
jgi:hypothetical protein